MKRHRLLSSFLEIGIGLTLVLLVVSPVAGGDVWEWDEKFYRSEQFAKDSAFFFAMQKRIREGDKSLRTPLLRLVADGSSSQTVFAALLLLRNDLATVHDLQRHFARIRHASAQLRWEPKMGSYPFRRELFYRFEHPTARLDEIPTIEKTLVEMMRYDDQDYNAMNAMRIITAWIKADPDHGIAFLRGILRDRDKQARQLAMALLAIELGGKDLNIYQGGTWHDVSINDILPGGNKLARDDLWLDALVESIRSDELRQNSGEFANACYGVKILLHINPFPRDKLAASFRAKDPQGDLVAVAILSERSPDAVTEPMMEFCLRQLRSNTTRMHDEVAFQALQNLGARAQGALRRALSGDDPQEIAFALILLDIEKALPKSLNAEGLLEKLLQAGKPVASYAVPDAALILAKRAQSWVRRHAPDISAGSRTARFLQVLTNPACDHTDIEAVFGGQSVRYRDRRTLEDRLDQYLSPNGWDDYIGYLSTWVFD